MGIRIDPERCRGCGACAQVCPGNLLDLAAGRAELRKPGECWTCLSCAKACPAGAIRGVLPYVLAGAGASLWPEWHDSRWHWICEHADGLREDFALEREGSD